MAFTSLWKVPAAINFLFLMFGATVCRADDCGPTAYAYEDRVALFACGRSGSPELRVILLDDGSPLRITGRVNSTASRSFDAASHYNHFLLMVTWDNFEIYELADPAHPRLAAKFQLKKQAELPGYSRIEKIAENKFLVISAIGVNQLMAEGEPAKWTLKEMAVTPDLTKKMSDRPPEVRFWDQNERTVVVRESTQFRYELAWRDKTRPGEIIHRQYLRKVDKATQRVTSELLLGERLETVD